MSSAAVSPGPAQVSQRIKYDPVAAVLSYLVPGLGQLYQGRFAKGLLFLVCLYGLFFYGMYLGRWKNVYVAPAGGGDVVTQGLERVRVAGQVWIGVAMWPAFMHHFGMNVPFLKDFQKAPDERELNDLQRDGDKTWDLGWVYTVIAGVLNILVIYDAAAGPALSRHRATDPEASEQPSREAAA